jgi:oligopeptide/dipeptide ABC transporter ATP-binding protein
VSPASRTPSAQAAPLLSVRDLSVSFHGLEGVSRVLENVRLDVMPGEILGLVGESGCGKSVMARALLRLLPSPPAKFSGEAIFRGENLLTVSAKRMREVRGGEISMIFQEPMTSLNPVFTVGQQMSEVLRLHTGAAASKARDICVSMLRQVNMPDPERAFSRYPHELSGGMRQRVMIAMELSCNPALLIADEPTTALDVTVQGQVLALLAELTRSRGVSTLFITHDMGVVAQLCERVAVMYAGKLVELVPVAELFERPLHPYSQGLIAAIPTLDDERGLLPSIPGSVPNPLLPPSGCRFHPRCAFRTGLCEKEEPPLTEAGGRAVACHHCQGEGR